MGTRSTTKIYVKQTFNDETTENYLLGFYAQYDGYIEGMGTWLKEFIKGGRFVNGYNLEDKDRIFNGIGCCVLQLITHFKKGVGGYYAIPESDYGEEYNYTITFVETYKDNKKTLKVIFECKEDEDYYEVLKVI